MIILGEARPVAMNMDSNRFLCVVLRLDIYRLDTDKLFLDQ